MSSTHSRKQYIRQLFLLYAKAQYQTLLSSSSSSFIAPYSPTPVQLVTDILYHLQPKKNDCLYDLGCGDGRWIFEASKTYHCHSYGIEMNAVLIQQMKDKLVKESFDVQKKIRIYEMNIFDCNLSNATIIIIYAFRHGMQQLAEKIQKEVKIGTRIISIGFHIEAWQPIWQYEAYGLSSYEYQIK